MLSGREAILLDMNGTFMFGEDRFGESEDYSVYYRRLGGNISRSEINRIVRAAYEYLEVRYTDENYRCCFPSLKSAILAVAGDLLDEGEIEKIIETFTFHELGYIPNEYAAILHQLRKRYTLAAVIDIWSPKQAWLKEFERAGITGLFSAISFSSDHGIVKPSPKPFEWILSQLGVSGSQAVVVGDSPRRDLGGARSAGIDCILVGGASHPKALMNVDNLLQLCRRD
ncbi:MAG: HAD family hydrolase [Gammaproteobacteria bacterium]|nr:HAD family hydrolase [Gammaproteobacteria bacterium]